MLRRIISGGLAATLILVALAGCGGSEASPSASTSASASATGSPAATTAPGASATSTTAPEPTASSGAVRMLTICAGVAIRKGPTMTDEVLLRAAKLTKVRVAGTVTGDPYQAGACGTSGADWIKIDRINGTAVKKLYGVPFAYAAAGFFQ